MVSPKEAVITCMKDKIFTFQGRAPRSEFWWFMLFNVVSSMVLGILLMIPILGAIIYLVGTIALFIAQITAAGRRLHDRDKPAWLLALPYALIGIALFIGIPIMLIDEELGASIAFLIGGIGSIFMLVLFIFLILPGTQGPNRFGDDPLANLATVSTVASGVNPSMAQAQTMAQPQEIQAASMATADTTNSQNPQDPTVNTQPKA